MHLPKSFLRLLPQNTRNWVSWEKKKKEKRKNEIYCLSSETSESKLKGVGRALLFLKLSGSWAIFGVPWHIDASLQSSVFTEHSPCVCLHIISSCKNVIDID